MIYPAIINQGPTFLGPTADGSANQVLATDGSGQLSFLEVAIRQSSFTDHSVIRADGTGGIQHSGVIIADDDQITGVAGITIDNIDIDGNTVNATSGDLELFAGGTYGLTIASSGDPTFSAGGGNILTLTGTTSATFRINDSGGGSDEKNFAIFNDGGTISFYLLTDAFGVKSTPITIETDGQLTGVLGLTVDNIDIDGNTISSTNTNGDINLTPDGTGNVILGTMTFDADQSIGASQDNMVLTYDDATGLISLEAAAGGSGWVAISTTNASAASSVDITSGLDSTYHLYMVVGRDITPSGNSHDLWFRISDDGSTFEADSGDYQWALTGRDAGGANNTESDNSDTEIHLTGSDTGNATNERGHLIMYLWQPSEAATFMCQWHFTYLDENDDVTTIHGSGEHQTAAAVLGIQFLFASGNISGDFDIYGLTKAA